MSNERAARMESAFGRPDPRAAVLVSPAATVPELTWLQHVSKRLIDIAIASLGLVVFGPAMVFTALLIWQGGGNALFRHERVGQHGRPFRCLKFRTMHVDADARLAAHLAEDPAAQAEWKRDQKLRHDPRITPLGRILRRWSIDELPQLINVLRGEMSVVGPRPIVRQEIERYGEHFPLYASVKPGLTGLWQISGRSGISYEDRVRLDRQYVQSRSVVTDLRIIALTVPAVLLARGAH